jgi:thiol-disulfide isomerase/thioredoxin
VQGCSAGGGCDIVLTSRWATLLGLPTSAWGLLGYAALAAIAFVRRVDQHWSWAWTVAFFGVCYSVYLTVVSLTILQSACPYCLTSLGLMAGTLALVTLQRPPEMAQRSWVGLAAGRAVLAAVVILVLHANYTAPQAESLGPEDPDIRALAEHLTEQGALFYGASWCPHCQEQKRLFGASVDRLPYVECSPAGPNGPQSFSCRQAGIQSYPTWFVNGRAIAVGQVLTLAQLAEATGFPGAAHFK